MTRPIEYGDAFEILWEQTGKRGGKFAAWKAWSAMGRPTWDAIGATWSAYLLSERPVAGFVKDLSSWLNGRGHEQEWPAASAPPRETRCTWHLRDGTADKPSRFPSATCDRCKHLGAARAGRVGSPEAAVDVMPEWARAPPPPVPTPEQRAEIRAAIAAIARPKPAAGGAL